MKTFIPNTDLQIKVQCQNINNFIKIFDNKTFTDGKMIHKASVLFDPDYRYTDTFSARMCAKHILIIVIIKEARKKLYVADWIFQLIRFVFSTPKIGCLYWMDLRRVDMFNSSIFFSYNFFRHKTLYPRYVTTIYANKHFMQIFPIIKINRSPRTN